MHRTEVMTLRHTVEQPSQFVMAELPGRLATVESDLTVPVGQALAVGLAAGVAVGVCTLLLGGPIAGLRGGALWAWSGRLAGVIGALATAVTTAFFVLASRAALRRFEVTTGQDIDGDGVVGEPESVKVELHNNKQVRFIDLPVSVGKLRDVARAVLWHGKAFSRPALHGVLTQTEYHKLAREMVRRGLVRDLPGNKRELTPAGRAILAKFTEG